MLILSAGKITQYFAWYFGTFATVDIPLILTTFSNGTLSPERIAIQGDTASTPM
jgi:hypothetical protein